jgi:hypothetical protein
MALDSSLLFLDEPSAGLDPIIGRLSFRQLISSCATEMAEAPRSPRECRSRTGANRDGYLCWFTSSNTGVANRTREEEQVPALASLQWIPRGGERWHGGVRLRCAGITPDRVTTKLRRFSVWSNICAPRLVQRICCFFSIRH